MQCHACWLALLAAFAFVGIACSSGGGGGVSSGGGNFSSLPSNRQVSSLNESERRQFCSDLATATPGLNEGSRNQSCAISAAQTARSTGGDDLEAKKAACRKAYQECLSTRETDSIDQKDIDECAASRQLAACSATIGELSACISQASAVLRSVATAYDNYCEGMQADGTVTFTNPSRGADISACTALRQTCPGFVGADDEATTDG